MSIQVSERLNGGLRPGQLEWTACEEHLGCARLTVLADPLPDEGADYPSITAHIRTLDVAWMSASMVSAFHRNGVEFALKERKP